MVCTKLYKSSGWYIKKKQERKKLYQIIFENYLKYRAYRILRSAPARRTFPGRRPDGGMPGHLVKSINQLINQSIYLSIYLLIYQSINQQTN